MVFSVSLQACRPGSSGPELPSFYGFIDVDGEEMPQVECSFSRLCLTNQRQAESSKPHILLAYIGAPQRLGRISAGDKGEEAWGIQYTGDLGTWACDTELEAEAS